MCNLDLTYYSLIVKIMITLLVSLKQGRVCTSKLNCVLLNTKERVYLLFVCSMTWLNPY